MHIALPLDVARQAVVSAWAELHPVALARMAPENMVMIYGPRNEEDAVLQALLPQSARLPIAPVLWRATHRIVRGAAPGT